MVGDTADHRDVLTPARVGRLRPWPDPRGDLPARARLPADGSWIPDVFAPAERDHAAMIAVVEDEGAGR